LYNIKFVNEDFSYAQSVNQSRAYVLKLTYFCMESICAVDIWCIEALGTYNAFNNTFFFHIICVSFEIDNFPYHELTLVSSASIGN
jgi:hypothetical protein